MKNSRRTFLQQAGIFTLASSTLPFMGFEKREKNKHPAPHKNHYPVPSQNDEDFWNSVKQCFTASPNILNLNNGGVSPQPRVTQEMQEHYLRLANEIPSYYLFNIYAKERESVRIKLAEIAGCSAEEIAINRNSSEGLETILFGLNLKSGDEVITTNQDYPNMLNALRQREKREGIKLTTISIPVPCNDSAQIVEQFRKAITPATKVILCCHMINLTGQILPIRAICDMAHEHGIEVVVDGAHTFAHLDYKINDLHCDYFATSLHKWMCAPFGTGMLWIKKDKIKNIWPLFGPPKDFSTDDIRKFEHLGTRSFAAELSISESINFHNGIGSRRKEERLRSLKNYWVQKVMEFPKIKMNTAIGNEYSCALANFTIEGKEPGEIHSKLFDHYKIYTTPISHEEFKGIRITPHIYTSFKELDYFVNAVEEISRS